MNGSINTAGAARGIVQVLNKEKIPIVLIPSVFKESLKLITANTIPYSPGELEPGDSSASQDAYYGLALQLIKDVAASAAAYGHIPAEK